MEKMNDSYFPTEPTNATAGGSSPADPFVEGQRIVTRRGGDPPYLGVSAAAMGKGDSLIGGSNKVFKPLGSSNHTPEERAANDYYATEPEATELLLTLEKFSPRIWEPACGEGHISRVLQAHGYDVISTDKVYRGFGNPEPLDFMTGTIPDFDGDIITNPPYSAGLEFVERALETVRPGRKVAMFLKVQFLEGKKRGELFAKSPPRTVYVSRSRLACAKNGDFTHTQKAIAYAWYIWKKGFTGTPALKWFN